MELNTTGVGFRIWGADDVVYGPVELPTLIHWVKDERVTADTWVFSEREDHWQKGGSVPELKMFFQPEKSSAASQPSPMRSSPAGLTPGSLRRVKIFANLSDAQLERFLQFMEVHTAPQWNEIVKQGEEGDAMYLVLEGELRVRLMIAGKENILLTLGVGDFFGEISIFDHGPRSADVLANKESVLLKISTTAFQRLLTEAPDLAAPFLFAMGKTLAARIRADNKRYRDSVNFALAAGK